MIQIKKTILTLVALLAVTTGAWADELSESFTTNHEVSVYTGEHFKITVGDEGDRDGFYLSETKNATIEALNGEIITKVEFTKGSYFINNFYCEVGTTNISGDVATVSGVNKTSLSFTATGALQIKAVKVYYTAPAAPSGPEVAWNKTSKTGTFTMPGGNVTLEPEYYPQAALTAEPTAINDVPATTDGAIVKAGTVANIGSTTTAQGTVMYYVSPTALDDAALLALAADAWKADVPTAESLAQGQAYVYYYVRGNDSDTDEENFNDGDILAANALTVTIAAEPTYAVTFAEGTEESDKWTVKAGTDGSFQSLPLEGVKAGTKVKLKYDGDRSMLKGVTAVKKAAAGIVNPVVGQVIGSDGKNYDANATLPDGVTAVAVIAYVGSETGDDTYKNGLAIALADESNSNWSTAKSTCEGKSAVSGAAWLLPSQKQWKTMFKANGGNEGSYSGLNTAIGTAGGTALQVNERYWSSSELDADFAWVLVLGENSAGWDGAPEDLGHQVRACLAF